jgi:4,5-dihydroxyphthalate decarboxylase
VKEVAMNAHSRRQFLATAGLVAGGTLVSPHGASARDAVAAADGAASSPGGLQAPTTLRLTAANYVRLMPIATGDVRPSGVDLTWIRGDRAEMLRRATDDPAVDGGETSMAQHVMRIDRNDRSLVAIPIFPLRNFTVRDLYTRKGSALQVSMLGGRRIGIYNWAASGAVWYRHLVRHLGHEVTKIGWVVGGVDAPADVRIPDPPPAHVTRAREGASLSDLLLAGEVDAIFAPLPPRGHHPTDGPIVRVFPDFEQRERRYFADTRCYPPQHVIVIRRVAWERNPTVGRHLVDAFNESERAFEALQRQFPYNSPWLIGEVEEAARVMGADYHAHGLEKNRHAVDAFCQSAFDDGLTKRRVTVDEFFAEAIAASASTSRSGA